MTLSPKKHMTATICLTIAVILGSPGCDDNNQKKPRQKTEAEKQTDFELAKKKIKNELEKKYSALMFSDISENKASYTFEYQEYFKNNKIPHFFSGCIYDIEKIKNEYVLFFKVKKTIRFFEGGKEFFVKAVISDALLKKYGSQKWFKIDRVGHLNACLLSRHVLVATVNNVRVKSALQHNPEEGFYIGDPVIFLEGQAKDIHEEK